VKVECVARTNDILGEGVIWNNTEHRLYWVDAFGPYIRRFDPDSGDVRSWKMPNVIGSLVFDRKDGIVAGTESGFCRVRLDPLEVEPVINPQPAEGIIFNDGKCDRHGRYFVGTMHADFSLKAGVLWRLDPDWTTHRIDSGITVSNGLAWSPDNRTMYFADTRALVVYAYDYDIETGAATNRRIFFRTDEMKGRVDGATVDTEGYYWCAMIHDGSVCRFDPSGKLDRRIELPVRHPTMCSFGGKDMDVLYVVTARRFLEPDGLKEQPLAGSLFAITGLDAKGIPEPVFAG
jgi:sugar lactone lactonase YvrE